MEMRGYIIQFGRGKIIWRIENFLLSLRDDRNSISSPNFVLHGISNTKWKMNLELTGDPTSEASRISLFLETLPGRAPGTLWASWEVTLLTGLRQYGPYETKCKFDERTNSKSMDNLLTIRDVMENLLPFSPDSITIQCDLIVYDNNTRNPMGGPPCGLTRLSEDLRRLKNTSKNYSDIKIRAQGKCIDVHKVILSRSKAMEDQFEHAIGGVIEIIHFNHKTVDDYVNFLYSGDIEFVLCRPTVSILKFLKQYDSDILKNYSVSEELNMLSKIKVDAHEFHWVLNNILEKDEFSISSPPIRRLNLDTIWKLRISLDPNQPGKYGDYISLFAEITGGQKPRFFSLEFAIETEMGEQYYCRRIVRFNNRYDELGFKDFIAKRSLIDANLAPNGCLRILFRIRTSDGCQEKLMGCRTMSFVTFSGAHPYEQLSADTSKLLENSNYSDVTIACGNRTFKAHKFILAARSLGFERRINSEALERDTLTVSDVKPELLTVVLDYIYSGDIKKPEVSQLLLLYTVSSKEKLDIPSLREESTRALAEKNIDIDTKDALIVAGELNNEELIQELQALRVNV